MRVGWARPGCRPDIELGADDQAFVFEGSRVSLFSSHTCQYKFTFPEFSLEPGINLMSGSWALEKIATTPG